MSVQSVAGEVIEERARQPGAVDIGECADQSVLGKTDTALGNGNFADASVRSNGAEFQSA